jgi:hypothetical protein
MLKVISINAVVKVKHKDHKAADLAQRSVPKAEVTHA